MQKRTYHIPVVEIAKVEGLYPMAIGDTSGHGEMAPPRRDPAF